MMGSGRDREPARLVQAERFKKTDSAAIALRKQTATSTGPVADKAGQLPHVAPSPHCRTRLAADEISIDGRLILL